ncbi:MAG: flavodoxin [Rhodoferax sp.]|jgi:flavodoxin|nr:flavodoxin [Rhodoferax sp.]
MRAKTFESRGDTNVKKMLVVYYSRSGFTGAVARRIARDCHADLLSIKDVKPRSGALGYLRSSLEAAMHWGSAIRKISLHGDYGLVVIGTPVWFWNISSPVRGFIRLHRPALKRVAFFCTYGGSGATKVLGDMAVLCGCKAVATLALRDDEIQKDMGGTKLVDFASQLNRLVEQPTRERAPRAGGAETFAHS